MERYLIIDGVRHVIDYNEATGDYTVGPEADLPEDAIVSGYPELVDVSTDLYASADTNITIEEIYTQLVINCDQTEIDELITSPLSDDDIYSPYTNIVHYCTEYASFGEGQRATDGFREMVVNGKTDYDGAKWFDWYI